MAKEKKPLRIVTEDGVTKIFDQMGNNLCEHLFITHMSIEYDAASQIPVIEMRLIAPDITVETDDAKVEIVHEETFKL